MRAFEVNDGTAEDFVERVASALAERGLDDYVSLRLEDPELRVRFRWMGVTELRYRLALNEGGFRADLIGERVSPLHAPFRGRFEERFDQVLEQVGTRSL